MSKKRRAAPPWTRDNPVTTQGGRPVPLTQAQKAEARERAARAGRRYPNLVDNMAVARKHRAPATKAR